MSHGTGMRTTHNAFCIQYIIIVQVLTFKMYPRYNDDLEMYKYIYNIICFKNVLNMTYMPTQYYDLNG